MYKHRFPPGFIWLIIAIGSAVLLFSLYGLAISKLGIPFLILAYLAIKSASRPPIMIANERFALPVTETLVFLSLLVFDGEAAALFACLIALCVSFQRNDEVKILIFYTFFLPAHNRRLVCGVRHF